MGQREIQTYGNAEKKTKRLPAIRRNGEESQWGAATTFVPILLTFPGYNKILTSH